MKKTISILFLLLYVAINTGLVVGVHNCLIKGSDYFLGAKESRCCCIASGIADDSACCNETTFVVKFEDVQTYSDVIPFRLLQPVTILPYLFSAIQDYAAQFTYLGEIILNEQWQKFTNAVVLLSPKYILYQQPKVFA